MLDNNVSKEKLYNIRRIFFTENNIQDGDSYESKKQYYTSIYDRLQFYKNNYEVVKNIQNGVIKGYKDKLSDLENIKKSEKDLDIIKSLDLAISGYKKLIDIELDSLNKLKGDIIEIYDEVVDFKLLDKMFPDFRSDIRNICDINHYNQIFSTNISTMCVLHKVLNFNITLMIEYKNGQEFVKYLVFGRGKFIGERHIKLDEILEESFYAHDRYEYLLTNS